MKIMVSACLLGENCKYNGGNNRNPELLHLLSGHEVIPVCPEVLGGLSTPRVPAEIVNGVVINREGVSADEAFRQGAKKALEIAAAGGHNAVPGSGQNAGSLFGGTGTEAEGRVCQDR